MQLKQTPLQYNGKQISIYNPENDDTIWGGLACLKTNEWEIDGITFNDGDVVLDIGANIGVLDLAISLKNPNVICYCFDASATATNCLRINAVSNGFFNIHPFHLGVADESRFEYFRSNGKEVTCLVKGDFYGDIYKEFTEKVKMVGILDVFNSPLLNLEKIKFFKLDIEGGEWSVLKALLEREDLLRRIEYFHVEFHNVGDFADKQDYIDRLTKIFGNKLFYRT